jgi:hypothetical protein
MSNIECRMLNGEGKAYKLPACGLRLYLLSPFGSSLQPVFALGFRLTAQAYSLRLTAYG